MERQPDDAHHQAVEEEDQGHILRHRRPHLGCRQKHINVVVALLEHHAIGLTALYIHHMMAVFVFLQILHTGERVRIGTDQISIIGGNDEAIAHHQDGAIFLGMIAREDILHRQVIGEGILGRRIIVHRYDALRVAPAASRHVYIPAAGDFHAVGVNLGTIFRCIQYSPISQRAGNQLRKAGAAVIFFGDFPIFIHEDDAAQPKATGMIGQKLFIHGFPCRRFYLQIAAQLPCTFDETQERLGLVRFIVIGVGTALHLHVIHRIQQAIFYF